MTPLPASPLAEAVAYALARAGARRGAALILFNAALQQGKGR